MIKVDAKLLSAMLKIAPKKDVRFYINSVKVEPHGKGALLVVTNGHYLVAALDKSGHADSEFLIPGDLCVQKGSTSVVLEDDVARFSSGATVPCKSVDGTYPDWRRSVPEFRDASVRVSLNTEYIDAVASVGAAFNKKNLGVSIGATSEDGAALVLPLDNSPWLGVIMPIRDRALGISFDF